MYKNILVPTDFSETANNAVDVAIQVATKTNARIHFIHLMSIPINWIISKEKATTYPGLKEKLDKVQENLSSLIKKAVNANVEALSYMHYNESKTGILQYAEEHQIDLIVMGSRGTGGVKELLIGSNTERVIRHAKCPVLTVKNKVNIDQIKIIMFPTDLSNTQSYVAQLANGWTQLIGAELNIVKLNTHYTWVKSSEFVDDINNFARKNDLSHFFARTFDADYLEDGIVKCAEHIDADMIVMGTHGRTGLGHIIAGSIAEDVANHYNRLILTANITKE